MPLPEIDTGAAGLLVDAAPDVVPIGRDRYQDAVTRRVVHDGRAPAGAFGVECVGELGGNDPEVDL